MSEKINPFRPKRPRADAKSEWRGQKLWWCINGAWISDTDLRAWAGVNFEYPWCYVDTVIRYYLVDAWALAHPRKDATPAPPVE